MEEIKEMSDAILSSVGKQNDPIGILLESYLEKKINAIVLDKLIDFQIYLSEQDIISDCDFAFEDKAKEFLYDIEQ